MGGAKTFALGAVFGQAGVEGGLCYGIVGGASASVFYVVGWFVFSLVPVADTLTNIRDAAQCIASGDGVGAALYGSGVLLSLVDAGAIATATGAVAIFIKLNPEKAAPLLRVLADVLKYLPDSVIEPTVRLFDKTGSVDNILECLQAGGGSWGDVLGLVTNGDGLEDIATIVSRASIYDAVALADKGASVAEIVQFVGKGQDLFTVGQVLEKGVRSADLLILVNKGARAGEVLQLLDKGAEIKDIGILVDKGVSLSRVIGWLNSGKDMGDIRYVMIKGTIEKTRNILIRYNKNNERTIMWLEEGLSDAEAVAIGRSSGTGWQHILIDHKQDFINKFGEMSDEELESLVYDAIQNGEWSLTKDGKNAFIYDVPPNNDPMSVITGSNGFIQSSYPGIASGVTF